MAHLNSNESLAVEGLSWNTVASARQLAKLAAFMANKGSLGEKQLLSEDGWNKLHAEPKKLKLDKQWDSEFTQGGVNIYDVPVPNPPKEWHESNNNGFVGWMGWGGSIFQWHPELKIGYAFNPFTHSHYDMYCYRGSRMQKIIVDILNGTY